MEALVSCYIQHGRSCGRELGKTESMLISEVLVCAHGEVGRWRRHIREKVAPATRVSGKAPKIVDHRSDGTANHTKHTRLTEPDHPLRQRPSDKAATHIASRWHHIRTKALPYVARRLAYL